MTSHPTFNTNALHITGMGLATALGRGAWTTFRALLNGRTLDDRLNALPADLAPVDLVRAVGCIPWAQHAGDDPAIELAEAAIREASQEASLNLRHPNGRVAIFLGTSKGAVIAWERAANALCRGASETTLASLAGPSALGPQGWMTHRLGVRLGHPVSHHVVAACASSLTALDMARRHLLADQCDIAIVATAEAALSPLFVHSYRRLGVLAPTTTATYHHRPLDARRQGFRLAEMAAAVVLTRPRQCDRKPLRLLNTAAATEASDLIRSDTSMAALAHIAQVLMQDQAIGAIHPHAPGTQEHDVRELQVLLDMYARVGGSSTPPQVYACKGAIGHGLGASGLCSLVLAGLALRSGRLPGMPWMEHPLPDLFTDPSRERATRHLHNALPHLIVAAGFAGHTAAALIDCDTPCHT